MRLSSFLRRWSKSAETVEISSLPELTRSDDARLAEEAEEHPAEPFQIAAVRITELLEDISHTNDVTADATSFRLEQAENAYSEIDGRLKQLNTRLDQISEDVEKLRELSPMDWAICVIASLTLIVAFLTLVWSLPQ